jgi:integrase
MPIEPFYNLFHQWGPSEELPIKQLRLKCITLLALAFMLRPSDVAPKGVMFNKETNSEERLILGMDQVIFEEDGKLTIKFWGIKNDTSREGFESTIPPSTDILVDPVFTLRTYLACTCHLRRPQGDPPKEPVFIALSSPYSAISAGTIANILSDAIQAAGLQGRGYSAKSFRPTGATRSVAAGIKPELIMQIGRWKTKEVFFNNYVHKVVPDNFTDVIVQ